MLIGEKIKHAIDIAKADPQRVANTIETSTANLYRIFKRDTVETKYITKLSEYIKVPIEFFYNDQYTELAVKADGQIVIRGKENHNDLETSVINVNSILNKKDSYEALTKADVIFELEKSKLLIAQLEQRIKDKDEMVNVFKEVLIGRNS